MVFGVDGQPLLRGIVREAARYREAEQHAVRLQPQVVVQSSRFMTVHDEAQLGAAVVGARGRLGRAGEVALGAVPVERRVAGGAGGAHRAASVAAARGGGNG